MPCPPLGWPAVRAHGTAARAGRDPGAPVCARRGEHPGHRGGPASPCSPDEDTEAPGSPLACAQTQGLAVSVAGLGPGGQTPAAACSAPRGARPRDVPRTAPLRPPLRRLPRSHRSFLIVAAASASPASVTRHTALPGLGVPAGDRPQTECRGGRAQEAPPGLAVRGRGHVGSSGGAAGAEMRERGGRGDRQGHSEASAARARARGGEVPWPQPRHHPSVRLCLPPPAAPDAAPRCPLPSPPSACSFRGQVSAPALLCPGQWAGGAVLETAVVPPSTPARACWVGAAGEGGPGV